MEFISRKITEEDLKRIEALLRSEMSEKRFLHTLGVKKEIAIMGELFLPDRIKELEAAALLHDITKEYSFEKQLQLCEKFGIILDNVAREALGVLHSKTGAYVAKEKFPELISEDIFNAIYRHTLGDANMSLFEKLLFLADFTEEGRTNSFCLELRAVFWDNFDALSEEECLKRVDEALLFSFDSTIERLREAGKPISKETISARNSLLS
jgi:nicotinate-nucleotide adenylyltransferase